MPTRLSPPTRPVMSFLLTSLGLSPSKRSRLSLRVSANTRSGPLDLPSAQREAMELVYFHGLTQAETARRTGQPLGTVKSRVRTGLRKLRDSLSGIEAP